MSKLHPVVAVTGSSGAGTSTVKRAFEHIFAREKIVPAVVGSAAVDAHKLLHIKSSCLLQTLRASRRGKLAARYGMSQRLWVCSKYLGTSPHGF